MDFQQEDTRPSATEASFTGCLTFFSFGIMAAVVFYSETLFISIVSSIFPAGILAMGAYIGAISTGLSILALVLGKRFWFRPGTQVLVSWGFTGVEAAILVLNDILAFNIKNGTVLPPLDIWYRFSPASPVIALVGWGLIWYFDPARKIQHDRMEMEDKLNKARLKFEQAQHEARLKISYKYLQSHTQQLESLAESVPALDALNQGSINITSRILNDLTGLPVNVSQLQAPKSIESTAKVLPQTGEMHALKSPSQPTNVIPFSINDFREVQLKLQEVTNELKAVKSRTSHDPNNTACGCDVCVSVRESGISPASGPVVSADKPARKKKQANQDGDPTN